MIIDMMEGNAAWTAPMVCRGGPGCMRAIRIVATDLDESYRSGSSPHLDHAIHVATLPCDALANRCSTR